MSDTVIVAIIVGVVAIVAVVVLRRRITGLGVDFRQGRIEADMEDHHPLPESGARQRGIEAVGNAIARDETGVGASQDNVKAGGDVSAVVTAPRGQRARRKKP